MLSKELIKRIISGLVGTPLFIFLVCVDKKMYGLPLLILLSGITALGVKEFCFLLEKTQELRKLPEDKLGKPDEKEKKPKIVPSCGLSLLVGLTALAFGYWYTYEAEFSVLVRQLLLLIVTIMIMLCLMMFLSEITGYLTKEMFLSATSSLSLSALGGLYVGGLLGFLVLLRNFQKPEIQYGGSFWALDYGGLWVIATVLGTWGCDTFAFFIGKWFGKRKLWPKVSPGKTWEGSAGGLLGSLFGISLVAWWLKLPLVHCLSLGLLMGIIGQLGDLTESALKRYAGVKDSGDLIPGHGGILDRFDSLLFNAPLVFFYVKWLL